MALTQSDDLSTIDDDDLAPEEEMVEEEFLVEEVSIDGMCGVY